MAYMTTFQLSVNTADPLIVEKIQAELNSRNLIGNIYGGVFYPTSSSDDETTEWLEAGMATWPTHEPDMREISKLFPNLLFELTGDGETGEVLWRDYYQDGKRAECEVRIEFEEFVPSKLM